MGRSARQCRGTNLEVGIQSAVRIRDRLGQIEPFVVGGSAVLGLDDGIELGVAFAFDRSLARFVHLEQRIALKLGFDELAQFHVRQLQEPDGLLQLGCHHQLLALSQLQLCRKRHTSNL